MNALILRDCLILQQHFIHWKLLVAIADSGLTQVMHQLMDILVLSTFNSFDEHCYLCAHFCVDILSVILGTYLGVKYGNSKFNFHLFIYLFIYVWLHCISIAA